MVGSAENILNMDEQGEMRINELLKDSTKVVNKDPARSWEQDVEVVHLCSLYKEMRGVIK